MGWFPDAEQVPGQNAGNLGNQKQNCRLHYTVGVDSTAIGVRGYFHFLIPKDAQPKQFAPTEAICWDACEWNPTGVGIEFERLSDAEPLTDNQILWGGRIIHWLNETDGIPLVFRDSPDDRMPAGTEYHGFTTHRSLHEQACDEHYDYVTIDDWDRMVGPVPAPPDSDPVEENTMLAVVTCKETKAVYIVGDANKKYVGIPEDLGAIETGYAAAKAPLPQFEWTKDTLDKWPTIGADFKP